jgi:hypothetical protein
MKNKRGLQLSMNMIVTVILALIFLGVAISFIYKFMPGPIPTVPNKCDIFPPNAESSVCVNENYEIGRGKTVQLDVSFYNNEDADILATVIPTITCSVNIDGNTLALASSSSGQNLPIGEAKDYLVLAKVPKESIRGKYVCNLQLSHTVKSFIIEVK